MTIDQQELADEFERHRSYLRAVAYRMLGSFSEAEDAVQEGWLRLSRSDASAIVNLRAWLTTAVARICLDILRSRRDEPSGLHLPDPILNEDPESEALLASSIGLALQVVIQTLSPGERIAFVLHDVFGVPFGQIGPILGRSSAATRQLASRARRRVRGSNRIPDADLSRQREVVDAFYAAARRGDFEGLMALLDPEVIVRADLGAPAATVREVRGARAVAIEVLNFANFAEFAQPALVNGAAGAVVRSAQGLRAVVAFTVARGKIVEVDFLADPARLRTAARG